MKMNSLRLMFSNLLTIRSKIYQNVNIYLGFRNASRFKSKKRLEENPEIPKNLLESYITAHLQPEKGVPYDCKPFKMLLQADKTYMWCCCGQGHCQPLCDGTHRFPQLNIKLRPVKFKVAETKEYWLCNCKQTKNRPFCDGSHRDPVIQDACKFKHVCTGSY